MGSFDKNKFPPHGWLYREASINWVVPNPMLPFKMVVDQIINARSNNPASGLSTGRPDVEQALKDYTRIRVDDPTWGDEGEVILSPPKKKKKRCPGCAKRKADTV